MNLLKVLVESFRMLLDQPKMFLPKIFSTSISTIWILSFPGLHSGQVSSVEVSSLIYYVASMPLIVLLGVFVSVMLAEMVADKPSLRRSLMKTLNKWKTLLAVSAGIIFSAVLLYIPTVLGIVTTFMTGRIVFTGAGVAVSLLLLLGFSFAIFFLPISIAEGNGLLSSFSNSLNASKKNSREVSVLMVFSLALLGVAFSMQGPLQSISIIGFIVSRFTSAITTTYLFVVSPRMYLTDK
ncbi:MAG: hypothetical protein ABEK10_00390 [Candidatus Nanosalina sp.]